MLICADPVHRERANCRTTWSSAVADPNGLGIRGCDGRLRHDQLGSGKKRSANLTTRRARTLNVGNHRPRVLCAFRRPSRSSRQDSLPPIVGLPAKALAGLQCLRELGRCQSQPLRTQHRALRVRGALRSVATALSASRVRERSRPLDRTQDCAVEETGALFSSLLLLNASTNFVRLAARSGPPI